MNRFIIYDRLGKKIGYEHRKTVHTKGFWHKGIQLNIYYNGKILVQERAEGCDIAWCLLDQSLAVQQTKTDNEDDYQSIKRGLLNELGIKLALLPKLEKVAGPYKLMKTYYYAPEIVNNEFVSLYRVILEKPIDIKINTKKVKSVSWMETGKLKKDIIKNPDSYTKTLSFWAKKNLI